MAFNGLGRTLTLSAKSKCQWSTGRWDLEVNWTKSWCSDSLCEMIFISVHGCFHKHKKTLKDLLTDTHGVHLSSFVICFQKCTLPPTWFVVCGTQNIPVFHQWSVIILSCHKMLFMFTAHYDVDHFYSEAHADSRWERYGTRLSGGESVSCGSFMSHQVRMFSICWKRWIICCFVRKPCIPCFPQCQPNMMRDQGEPSAPCLLRVDY